VLQFLEETILRGPSAAELLGIEEPFAKLLDSCCHFHRAEFEAPLDV